MNFPFSSFIFFGPWHFEFSINFLDLLVAHSACERTPKREKVNVKTCSDRKLIPSSFYREDDDDFSQRSMALIINTCWYAHCEDSSHLYAAKWRWDSLQASALNFFVTTLIPPMLSHHFLLRNFASMTMFEPAVQIPPENMLMIKHAIRWIQKGPPTSCDVAKTKIRGNGITKNIVKGSGSPRWERKRPEVQPPLWYAHERSPWLFPCCVALHHSHNHLTFSVFCQYCCLLSAGRKSVDSHSLKAIAKAQPTLLELQLCFFFVRVRAMVVGVSFCAATMLLTVDGVILLNEENEKERRKEKFSREKIMNELFACIVFKISPCSWEFLTKERN